MSAPLRPLLLRLLWALPLCYVIWALLSSVLNRLLAPLASGFCDLFAPAAIQFVRAQAAVLEVGIHVDQLLVDGEFRSATVVHNVDGQLYTHGMAFFFALLIAGNGLRWRRAHLLAFGSLWLVALFSLLVHILWLGVFAHATAAAAAPSWLAEGLVVADHVGGLVLPTLAPVALWLWAERQRFWPPPTSGQLS